MLSTFDWTLLETRMKLSRLLLLFKLLKHLVYVPENRLPVFSPSEITRASHSIQQSDHLQERIFTLPLYSHEYVLIYMYK